MRPVLRLCPALTPPGELVIKDGLPFRDGWRVFTRDEVGRHNRYTDGWVRDVPVLVAECRRMHRC